MSITSLGLWGLLVLAIAGTYVWRGLGVVLAARLNPRGRLVGWITCVSYAMLAGLISRMILLPAGPLAEASLGVRVTATLVAFMVFIACRRSVTWGVLAGTSVFVVLLSGT